MNKRNHNALQTAILENQCANRVQPNGLKNDSEDTWQSTRGRKIRLILAYFFWIVTLPISVFLSFEVIPANMRAVVWRFGKLISPEGYGPGLLFYNPFCDRVRKIDIREQVAVVPNQKYVTKDAVTVGASFIMRIKLSNPQLSICTTMNQISLAQTVAVEHLRLQFQANRLERFWKSRTAILFALKSHLNMELAPFGLLVMYIELTNVNLPLYLKEPLIKLVIENRRAKIKEAVLESQLAAIESGTINLYEHDAPPLMEYVKTIGLENCSKSLQRILAASNDDTRLEKI
ncbi:hypothetical protein M514_01781, partial [Trichuris suis]